MSGAAAWSRGAGDEVEERRLPEGDASAASALVGIGGAPMDLTGSAGGGEACARTGTSCAEAFADENDSVVD